MNEKINRNDTDSYVNDYFKPKGKYEKRKVHKKFRRMKNLPTNLKGIMNRVGVYCEWE